MNFEKNTPENSEAEKLTSGREEAPAARQISDGERGLDVLTEIRMLCGDDPDREKERISFEKVVAKGALGFMFASSLFLAQQGGLEAATAQTEEGSKDEINSPGSEDRLLEDLKKKFSEIIRESNEEMPEPLDKMRERANRTLFVHTGLWAESLIARSGGGDKISDEEIKEKYNDAYTQMYQAGKDDNEGTGNSLSFGVTTSGRNIMFGVNGNNLEDLSKLPAAVGNKFKDIRQHPVKALVNMFLAGAVDTEARKFETRFNESNHDR